MTTPMAAPASRVSTTPRRSGSNSSRAPASTAYCHGWLSTRVSAMADHGVALRIVPPLGDVVVREDKIVQLASSAQHRLQRQVGPLVDHVRRKAARADRARERLRDANPAPDHVDERHHVQVPRRRDVSPSRQEHLARLLELAYTPFDKTRLDPGAARRRRRLGMSGEAGELARGGERQSRAHERAHDDVRREVLAGAHPGRRSRDELTVYAPVGLPWQDLAAAWIVYRAAVAHGRGVDLDLLA